MSVLCTSEILLRFVTNLMEVTSVVADCPRHFCDKLRLSELDLHAPEGREGRWIGYVYMSACQAMY